MVYNQIHQNMNREFTKSSISHTGLEISNQSDLCVRKKKGKQYPGLKLKPMNAPVGYEENTKKSLGNKPINKINCQNLYPAVSNSCRRYPSKIPVLQYPKTEKINYAIWDTSLSAADKRHKFHQSRLYVAPPCYEAESKFPLQHIYYKDTELKYNVDVTQEPISCSTIGKKLALPPIKGITSILNGKENTPQAAKKCLRGEITHFPALCLPSKSPLKKCGLTSVPHLPPIFTSPVAPPPSVSTSLEKDSYQAK